MSTHTNTPVAVTGTARSRLSAAQEASLSTVATSFAMESMAFTEDELEVLATYALGEISGEEYVARLDAMNAPG